MNDRGLSLTPTDMLKGYLLANITDSRQANSRERKSGSSACRRWPSSARTKTPTASRRGCAASTPRASASASAGAAPQDFDLIGTEFHRWVRDHEERLGLSQQRRLRPLHRARLRLLRRAGTSASGRRPTRSRRAGVRPLQRAAQLHAAIPGAARAAPASTMTKRRSCASSASSPRTSTS